MENTKVKVIFDLAKGHSLFEIKRVVINDPKAGNFVINNEETITNMLLRIAITKEHWFEVSELLRDEYDCCANNLDIEYIRN